MYRKYCIVESIGSSVSQYKSCRDQVYRYTPSAFLFFLHPSEWQKMQSGLDINLSVNDHFPAEWVPPVLWPAELDK